MSITDLCRRLDQLSPLVRAHAADAERAAALGDAAVRALQELGLFKLWVPRRFGGRELDVPDTLRVYEAAAAIDGSFGWAVMIGSGGGLFAAYLDSDAANHWFSPANAVVAGSGAPSGRAERVSGGYRASGRWRYASGARYATVFTANCIVTSEGTPVLDDSGRALIRAMSFAPSDVTVIPTWNATGMRATGSHDFEVHEVFVPEAHTFSVSTDAPREAGTLYRLPFEVLTHLPIVAVGLGIARHALAAFAKLTERKQVPYEELALAADSNVHARYAEAHARWLSVQLALHALGARSWETVARGEPLSERVRAEIAASCTLFVADLQTIAGELARMGGMNGVLHDDPLARAWRDLQTLAAHASVSPLRMDDAGKVLLAAQAIDG